MPEAKKDHYKRVGADRLKQTLMMKEEYWTGEQIKLQDKQMKGKIEVF